MRTIRIEYVSPKRILKFGELKESYKKEIITKMRIQKIREVWKEKPKGDNFQDEGFLSEINTFFSEEKIEEELNKENNFFNSFGRKIVKNFS
jgi:hypothetical protein